MNLGRVAIVAQGSYSLTSTYKKLDTVEFNGSTYIALMTVEEGESPAVQPTKWMLGAKAGKDFEAIYNNTSETLAEDIVKRIDINTGIDVNYKPVTLFHDDTVMTDAKVDGILYRKTGNNVYERLQWVGEYPVKMSGSVGDGNTDDTVTLQKFIDSIPEGGVIVFDARYLITSPLIISKAMTIRGSQNSFIITVGNDALYLNANEIILEDIKIGNASRHTTIPNNATGVKVNTIGLSIINKIKFRNVFVDGHKTAYEVNNIWDSEFTGIKSYSNQFGFIINGLSVNNEMNGNCSFNLENSVDSIGVKFGDETTVAEGWRLFNVFTFDAYIGLKAHSFSHVSLQNCMFDFCKIKGIELGDKCYNWNISACYIAISGMNGQAGIHLATITDNAYFQRGHKITGNDMTIYADSKCLRGIHVEGAENKYDHIDNNSIKEFVYCDIECSPNSKMTTIVNNKCLTAVQENPFGSNIIGNYITLNNIGKVYYQLLKDQINLGRLTISYSNTKPTYPNLNQLGDIVFNSEPQIGKPIGWTRIDSEGGFKSFGIIKEDFKEKGTTAERPIYVPKGFQYYDITLSKPIWAKDVTNPTSIIWSDSSGIVV